MINSKKVLLQWTSIPKNWFAQNLIPLQIINFPILDHNYGVTFLLLQVLRIAFGRISYVF